MERNALSICVGFVWFSGDEGKTRLRRYFLPTLSIVHTACTTLYYSQAREINSWTGIFLVLMRGP